ncbi:MAG: hypothetical protein HQL20_02275 [Candidatus Omnitrophica bacterium]|nr:hypothetical protein [Candidatus Omnitrophota bacterium]
MVQFKFNDNNAFGGVGKMGGKSPVAMPSKLTVESVKEFALKRKAETFCVVLVLVTGIVVWLFITSQLQKVSQIKSDVQLLLDKETVIAKFNKVSTEGAALMGTVPGALPENRFITQLTALANKRNVAVTAISPPSTKDSGFFRYISTQLSCSADNFNDALLFINDVDQSEFALKVDSWKVRQAGAADFSNTVNPAGASGRLDMVIVVSSIDILGNEKAKSAK